MSETPPTTLPAPRLATPWLRPRWLLLGLAVGLTVMAVLGRRAPAEDYHPGFTRFFPAISPEAAYYPTVEEMAAIVRARTRPDQILVIVGGNSVLQGISQPADRMWTKVLQDQLGPRYAVINLALRGAMPMDGGAVVAEALRTEFPRQIYIANEKPVAAIDALGSNAYRVIFWQAYFSGHLAPWRAREEEAHRRLWTWRAFADTPGILGEAVLDRFLRFRDFWNRTAFTRLNTVASLYAPAPPALFSPRNLFRDEEIDGETIPVSQRYRPEGRETELAIIRANTSGNYLRNAAGAWEWKPESRRFVGDSYARALPPELRARTLMLFGRESPFYRRGLAAEEQARDEQSFPDSVALLHSLGYAAIDYGTDFNDADYFDRSHLTAPGGRKLATVVAQEVRRLAGERGYLP